MKLITTTNSWSIECGDHEYYHKSRQYKRRLILDANELEVYSSSTNNNYTFKNLTNTNVEVSGKVIFKDEYLIILENKFRFGIVLNNQFRFGNNNYIGNKDIDCSKIDIGDTVLARGNFSFQKVFFCIFTYLNSESDLPNIDYLWKVNNIYKIESNAWDTKSLEELKEVDYIDTQSQSINDAFAIEFELQDSSSLPYDQTSGVHGFVDSISWIDESNWVINCKGRINNGVKKGEWFYLDKKGENKLIFKYSD